MVNALEMKGIQYELEFLGDGTGRKYLEKAFHTRENITFHGKKLGAEYWKIMGEWDFVIYTSDFEGSPLAMQEAMNAGCLPIFPSIQCGGDLVVKEISEDLLYKPEDYQSIACTLLDWQKRPPSFRWSYQTKRNPDKLRICRGQIPCKIQKFSESYFESTRNLKTSHTGKRPLLGGYITICCVETLLS